MSQEVLAFEANLTSSYVSQIEAGKRNPSVGVLYRVCRALDCELADLLKT